MFWHSALRLTDTFLLSIQGHNIGNGCKRILIFCTTDLSVNVRSLKFISTGYNHTDPTEMKTIPIQYIHQPINNIEGNKDCFFWECYSKLCCFITYTILKPTLYHEVPDFFMNPTSFMSTEFSEITLLRNILCMSTNQNQEHLINCIKKHSTELLAEKWWVCVFGVAEASKMQGPISKSTPHDNIWATKWIKNCSNQAFRLRNAAT